MKIHALQTGRVQVKCAQLIGQGHGLKRRLAPLTDTVWSDWLPTYAFAVEHADGVILIDTGSNAGLMNLPRWHPYFRLAVRFDIDREQEVGVQLGRIGIAPRDVKKVVLTHMHIDHDCRPKGPSAQRGICFARRGQMRVWLRGSKSGVTCRSGGQRTLIPSHSCSTTRLSAHSPGRGG